MRKFLPRDYLGPFSTAYVTTTGIRCACMCNACAVTKPISRYSCFGPFRTNLRIANASYAEVTTPKHGKKLQSLRQNTFPCQNLSECVALPIFLVLCCPPLGTAGCKAGCRIFSTVCRGHTHRVPRGSGAAPLPVMTPDAPMHLRRVLRAMLNFGHARPRHAPRQRRPARAPRGLGCDQSGDALCTRRSAYLAATKVWRCAQYARTQSRPKWIRAQYGAGCRHVELSTLRMGHERRKSGAVMGSFVFERSQSRVVERV